MAYAQQAGWDFLTDHDDATTTLADFLSWPSDGVIATVTSEADVRRAKACGRPVVNISGVLDDPTLPQVTFDNYRIGELAAAHLRTAGYTEFAYVGLKDVFFSDERARGFRDALAEFGHRFQRLDLPSMLGRRKHHGSNVDLGEWVSGLPEGTGILVVTDSRAEQVLRACGVAGRRVPADLGVLGVGDFRDICERSSPSLSSIHRQGHEVGLVAAKLLASLMAKPSRGGASQRLLLLPAGVVARDSTARAFTGNTLVAEVARYLAEHASEQFGMERLIEAFSVSRRTLERDFRGELGVSPAAYLLRVRAQNAIEFATKHPEAKHAGIALATGFTDDQHLRRTLRRLGLSLPTESASGKSP
jgi:LacI family transcriptional regulator